MSRTTHSLGVTCSICGEQLLPDNCCTGQPHGSTFQEPSEWAAKTWPNHACFRKEGGEQ